MSADLIALPERVDTEHDLRGAELHAADLEILERRPLFKRDLFDGSKGWTHAGFPISLPQEMRDGLRQDIFTARVGWGAHADERADDFDRDVFRMFSEKVRGITSPTYGDHVTRHLIKRAKRGADKVADAADFVVNVISDPLPWIVGFGAVFLASNLFFAWMAGRGRR